MHFDYNSGNKKCRFNADVNINVFLYMEKYAQQRNFAFLKGYVFLRKNINYLSQNAKLDKASIVMLENARPPAYKRTPTNFIIALFRVNRVFSDAFSYPIFQTKNETKVIEKSQYR